MTSTENRVSLISIAIGTLIPVAFAAIIGSAVAPMFSDWNGPLAVIEGAVCGVGMALVIGFAMSWHGAAIGGSPGRCATAALWGIVTGAVLGLALGPPLGAAVGIFFG